jgi:hypothetical protein
MSWSPDGRFILYAPVNPETGLDVFVLPLFGDRKPYPFLKTQFTEFAAQFSPDGRWVAYDSNESGKLEVYVAPFPGPGGKWRVSTGGGFRHRWTRGGSELVYIALDNTLMAAAVNGKGSSFEVGGVKPLFRPRIAPGRDQYDVTADGQRFLIDVLPEETVAPPITVVVNWQSGLTARER